MCGNNRSYGKTKKGEMDKENNEDSNKFNQYNLKIYQLEKFRIFDNYFGLNYSECDITNNFQSHSIKISSFEFIRQIGFGSFGKVYLTKNKEDDQLYALKCYDKAKIIEQNEVEHIKSERK